MELRSSEFIRLDTLTYRSMQQGTLTACNRARGQNYSLYEGYAYYIGKGYAKVRGIKCTIEFYADNTVLLEVRDGSDPYILADIIGGEVVGDMHFIRTKKPNLRGCINHP